MRTFFIAVGVALAAAGAHAQQLSYVGSGLYVPPSYPAFIEAWGTAGQYTTADPISAPAYASLFNRPNLVTQAALSGFVSAQTTFAYDAGTAAASTTGDANGAISRYRTGSLTATLASGTDTASLSDTAMAISVQQGYAYSVFNLGRGASTLNGALPGNTFAYTDPAPVSQSLDLVSFLNSGGSPQSFDLSGFATLPVHMRSPTRYVPVYVGISGMDDRAHTAPFDTALPNPLTLSSYNQGLTLEMWFDGVYTVSVQRDDFASEADYQSASGWVTANLRQFNYESALNYRLQTLQVTAVPEPAPVVLLLAGLGVLAAGRRARAAAKGRVRRAQNP